MPDLLADYLHADTAYDELLDARGDVRPHWQRLIRAMERSSLSQMNQRQALLERQIQENGVTYNVHADAHGGNRQWALDLLPNLIALDEWQQISAGVAQRAGLLNRVLADLYGPQTLLREGLLPAELIFGHNNFLWPCHGMQVPGDTWLHIYAVDLARAPDGRWWVLADRTQTPSGAGYALENRQIISRAFPELYRDLRVQHLAGFFRSLQEYLRQQAPAEGETPLVVLLTPGRFHETYFEHLYLARQLGFPLVEGSDLTVRDNTLYLKTLDGLKRVHALLRRLDDDFCDPLELRTDSALGVAGLLEVIRQGRVLVANALGSGVLESPGLLGFLPAISEHWLGQELLLPSIATWWCGEPPVLEEALEKLAELVIKPAFPSQSFEPVFGRDLDEQGLQELTQRLMSRPYAYVAQELAQLSQAGVWDGRTLQPRAIGLRVYAVATKDGYRVLPGGLTRVAGLPGAEIVSMQRGGSSKDTWVLGERTPVGEPWSWSKPLGVHDLIRSDPYLPSRVVENLYWFGRYSERCDDGARLLRVLLSRYVDDAEAPLALGVAVELGETTGWLPPGKDLEQCLRNGLFGADWPYSLKANLQNLQGAASQVRGKLSQENWQALVELQRETQLLAGDQADLGELLDFLNRLLMSLASLSGFAMDDMTRDDGWRFLMIGRRIERLKFLAESLAVFLRGSGVRDQAALEWLLELGNSIITYRTRYLAAPQLIPVLDLLLLDAQNPHSLVFQLQMLERSLRQLDERFAVHHENPLQQLAEQLTAFDLGSLDEQALFGTAGVRAVLDGLADLLQALSSGAGQLSDRLALRHFAHVDDISQQTLSY